MFDMCAPLVPDVPMVSLYPCGWGVQRPGHIVDTCVAWVPHPVAKPPPDPRPYGRHEVPMAPTEPVYLLIVDLTVEGNVPKEHLQTGAQF
jgi:hypothetical protein